jgi:hypothetical protein
VYAIVPLQGSHAIDVDVDPDRQHSSLSPYRTGNLYATSDCDMSRVEPLVAMLLGKARCWRNPTSTQEGCL